MALTGLDIYKRLPKENCRECGVPTCLAFAMKVAAGQAGLSECPRLSEEARAELSEASAPPQRLVKIGPEQKLIEVGQETVLFRHDEKFYHPTAVALRVSDDQDPEAIRRACSAFRSLQFPRVGEILQADMIALVNESDSPQKMSAAAEIVSKELGVPMVLMSRRGESLAAAATGPLAGARPVLYCPPEISAGDWAALADLAQKTAAPLCVAGELNTVAERVEALGAKGAKNVLISPGDVAPSAALAFLTRSRRAALNKKYRPLGCPVLAIAAGADKVAAALDACAYVCKYAAVIVSDAWEPYLLLPILTIRQNIYTDPQKPVQVEAKLYEIGEVAQTSPLLVTTNFSLSYYAVESEVEASRIPCRILAVDTEGTSVLTSWASDKFNPKTITAALKSAGAEGKVKHHRLVIPGLVAVMAAPLGEESGWEVLVGPKEASGIGPFLKSEWKSN
ncbi:MAG: acetyl-CoA decarbonylase/synthase complex subunit gamma [Phycisphaerae bacterium]|nr:acetyl-CoA decarbonylase/synthase complex subunit gamma [Phycisphaerae bacterium]